MTAGDSHGFEVGCLVVWQPHGIYGCVVELDHRRMTVEMDGGDTKVLRRRLGTSGFRAGQPDRDLDAELLRISRRFDRQETEGDPDLAALDVAHEQAIADVAALADGVEADARRRAKEGADKERSRIDANHRYRLKAAQDRLDAARQTLARLEASELESDQAVVPLWRANVGRAEAELARIDQDRDEMLADLSRRMTPTVECQLLNVARVVGP